ncbi:MAG: hypothetical protein Q3993_03000, partial [Filifactor alocis]|nr:hypothetical protein [Filifactor alocis]
FFFLLIVFLSLGLVYSLLGKPIRLIVDGEKHSFGSYVEMQKYLYENIPQYIFVKNDVDPTRALEIPLSEIGASYLSPYDMEEVKRIEKSDLFQKMNLFFVRRKGSKPIIVERKRIYYEPKNLQSFIESGMTRLDFQPYDAFIKENATALYIEPDKQGISIEPAELFYAIESGLRNGSITDVKVSGFAVPAEVRESDIQKYSKKKVSVTTPIEAAFLQNSVMPAILYELNNTLLPSKQSVDVKQRARLYVNTIVEQYSVSEESRTYIYNVMEKVFSILSEALQESGFALKESEDGTVLKTYNPDKKDAIISAYLEQDTVRIIIATVE